jgi:hypothetical protein
MYSCFPFTFWKPRTEQQGHGKVLSDFETSARAKQIFDERLYNDEGDERGDIVDRVSPNLGEAHGMSVSQPQPRNFMILRVGAGRTAGCAMLSDDLKKTRDD